jgi:peptide/nickel transport system substrate-binding protein
MSIVRRSVTVALILVAFLVNQIPVRAQTTKTLTIGTVQPLINLDPADAGDVGSWEILTHLYTGLTRQISGSLNYELALAASHTISEDGLTHTFTIKSDAVFDDGTPITAQTFADSIMRVMALNLSGSGIITPTVDSVTVNSANALEIKLHQPLPYIDQLVALPPFAPVHPAIFTKDALNRTPEKLISNGVYKLESVDAGKSITLTANPAWTGKPPATPTIILRHFELSADLRDALKAHQVDMAWRGLPPDDVENALKTEGLTETSAPSLQTFYLLFGQDQKPFSDLVVRQGMQYIFDRDQDLMQGTRQLGFPLYTLVPAQLASGKTPVYPNYDFNQAQTVLDKGGYSKYKRVESELQTARNIYGDVYSTVAQLLSSNLSRSTSFNVGRQDTAPRTFLDIIDRGTFRLVLIGWTPVVPHPYAYLQPLLAGQLAAGAHYSNPEIVKLLNHAAMTTDLAQQTDLYDQVQTLAAQDVIAIPLWQGRQSLVAWNTVQGITIEPNFLLHYDTLQ